MKKQDLLNYKKQTDSALEKDVIRIILRNSEGDISTFFKDLFEHGCVSGMIGDLIYYSDTGKFAKKHIEEILELKSNLEEETGEPVVDRDKGDELNFLAWLGFEETARKIYHELDGKDY